MPVPSAGFIVDPRGAAVSVSVAKGNSTAALYADAGGVATISNPTTISSRTVFYVEQQTTYTVTVAGTAYTVDLSSGGVAQVPYSQTAGNQDLIDTAGLLAAVSATSAPLLVPTATKTGAYAVQVGELAMMNVAGGATTLTLPTAPADKAQVGYRAIGATTTVPLAVACGGTDTIGTAGATSASIALADEVVVLQYDAANTRWLGVGNVKTQASLDGRFVPILDTRDVVLRKFRAGLANRNSGRCSIVGIGHSFMQGQGATTWNNTTVARLAANLRSRFPQTPKGGRGYISANNHGPESTYTWPCVLAGSPQLNGFGITHTYCKLDDGTKTLTFTLQGTACDIMYNKLSGGGVIYYTVDGGAQQTFATSNASRTVGNLQRVTLGSSGAHTLVIGWSSGGFVEVEGVVEYDGDESSGIIVHNGGWTGSKVSDWNGTTTPNWAGSIAALAPDLILLELGINDVGVISASTFQTNLATLLATIRSALTAPYPPICLIASWGSGDFSAATWAPFVAALNALALADGQCVVFDGTQNRFAYPTTSTDVNMFGLLYDTKHPSDKGHQARADALTDYLAPH